MPPAYDRYRKIALFTLNMPLRLALTTVAFASALQIWGEPLTARLIVELAAVSLTLRALIQLQCGFTEAVGENRDARLLLNNFKSEIKYSLAIVTLAYLSDYSVSKPAVLTFLALNTILQALPLLAQQMIRTVSRARSEQSMRSDAGDLGLKAAHTGRTAVIFGTGARGKWAADMLTSNPQSDITPIGFIDSKRAGLWSFRDVPLVGAVSDLKRLILERQVDLVFIACEPEDLKDSREVFAIAEEMGAPVCVLPQIYESTVGQCRVKTFNGQPALVYSSEAPEGVTTFAKDVLDRVAAFVGLTIISPFLLISALAVKLTSRGPVFFKQTRSGKNGAGFEMLKFRSMRIDADDVKVELAEQNEMSGPMFKIKNDPRVTPIGRFMRKYSIDELPQLFNVLRGEMSLVGPRPALPSEVAQFSPWQRRKLAVKPGLTCIWQVSGRNDIDFENWMKLDLEYIDNWSLWLDAKLIARTIPTVIKGSGC